MKTFQLLDQRAWEPDSFITPTGIVLNKSHVLKVLPVAEAKAALLTTVLIKRIMSA